jgi:S1-C subfamily serine protease
MRNIPTTAVAVAMLLLVCGASKLQAAVTGVTAEPLSTRQIADSVSKATVTLRSALPGGVVSSGTGFIVDSSGTIVTNYHVVKGAERIEARTAMGDSYDVTAIRAVDKRRDIAIVQIPGFKLPTVTLGDSDTLAPGEPVLVIGNALGLLDNSVTTGVVSGIREVEGNKLIQMSAAVSPGNSGGPVANAHGEVVAITVSKLIAGESLNFSIPINYARGYIAQPAQQGLGLLRETGEKSLFASSPGAFPKRWHSLNSNTDRTITIADDVMLVEVDVPNQAKQAGQKYWMDLRKEGETWKGVIKRDLPCAYESFGPPIQKMCYVEYKAELTTATPSRIEGIGYPPPPEARLNCKKCIFDKPGVGTKFTWIPADN